MAAIQKQPIDVLLKDVRGLACHSANFLASTLASEGPVA